MSPAAVTPADTRASSGDVHRAHPASNGRNGNGHAFDMTEGSKPPIRLPLDTPPAADNHEPVEILLVDDAPDKLLALEAALSDLG